MRTGGALFHSTTQVVSRMTTAEATTTAKATFSPPTGAVQRSPWHSPVPYLFGGLAAMLGLIAFALLILACSYWKLSGTEDGGERDVESGAAAAEKGDSSSDAKSPPVFEEKFLVIMAGEVNPTFLATPMSSRTIVSSFNDGKVDSKVGENEENIKQKYETTNEDQNGDEGDDQLRRDHN